MTYTRAHEDAACQRIESDASTMVEALQRLDDLIHERDREIERLKSEVETLKAQIEEENS